MDDEFERFRSWGRIGGLTAQSRHSADEMLAGARRGFEAKFEKLVDPDGILEPRERRRRAELAKTAHMLRLALRSAEARRAKKAARGLT